jgi:hypothetical protein
MRRITLTAVWIANRAAFGMSYGEKAIIEPLELCPEVRVRVEGSPDRSSFKEGQVRKGNVCVRLRGTGRRSID